jgi:hypothetical protein
VADRRQPCKNGEVVAQKSVRRNRIFALFLDDQLRVAVVWQS